MKAKRNLDTSFEYMEYPSKKYPAPEWFFDALKTSRIYTIVDCYFVRTEVGTVSFPPKGFVLIRLHSGEFMVMNRAEFFRIFEGVEA